MVAWRINKAKRSVVGKVTMMLEATGLVKIMPWKLGAGEAYGPYSRRMWMEVADIDEMDVDVSTIVKVELDEHGVLTAASIEQMAAAGLPAGR